MSEQFEKHAREQFEQHQVSLDVESLWEEVYPQVKEEKKDRKFLWFFFGGFLLSAVLVAGLYFLQRQHIENTSPAAKQFSESISKNTDTDLTTSANKVIPPSKESTDANNNVSTITDSEVGTTIGDNKVTANNITLTNTNKKTVTTLATESKPLQPTNSGTTTEISTPIKTTSTNKTSVENNTAIIEEINTLTEDRITTVDMATISPTAIINKQENILSPFNLTYLQTSIYDVKLDFPIRQELPPVEELKKASQSYPKKSITKGMRFGIGLYGGISNSSSTFTAVDSTQEAYRDLRNPTEEQLESIHFGIEAILETKQNIYLRTGLEYTRIGSVFSTESELITTDSMEGTVLIQINSLTNDTTFIGGMKEITTTERYRKKTYNYFHLIDIPIILGYNLKYEKWQVGLEGGVFANVFLKRKGDIFSPNETVYDISSDDDSRYKSNIGITPFIGLNAAYNISDHFQIHVSPAFRFNKTFTTNNSLIKEEIANLGLRLGLRYFL